MITSVSLYSSLNESIQLINEATGICFTTEINLLQGKPAYITNIDTSALELESPALSFIQLMVLSSFLLTYANTRELENSLVSIQKQKCFVEPRVVIKLQVLRMLQGVKEFLKQWVKERVQEATVARWRS